MLIVLIVSEVPLQFSVTPVAEGAKPPIADAKALVPYTVPEVPLGVFKSDVSCQLDPFQSSVLAPAAGIGNPPKPIHAVAVPDPANKCLP